MVVTIKLGRRIPKKGMQRLWKYGTRFLSGQEHMWTLLVNSFTLAKKAANEKPSEGVMINIEKDYEDEDKSTTLEWRIITIKSEDINKEREEYIDSLKLFDQVFTKQDKKKLDEKIERSEEVKTIKETTPFKTNHLLFDKIKKAGYKYAENKTYANIFNEFHIVLDIQNDWKKKKKKSK